ncbi:hypothetical protein L0152_23150 [bacterium]|nr:hypothetical protein [bacterium]
MVRKINNNVPNSNPAESKFMHGDFSTFEANPATKSGGEVVSADCAKSMAIDAKGIQDTNAKLLIKSLNGKLQESELPRKESSVTAQYNPKEHSE